MRERAIFLDRDNTIIDNDGYLGDPSKVKLLPGAGAALAGLRRLGYKLIVVSNQSGVARGMFSEADVEKVNQEMCRQLKEQADASIDASYYCPYHPEAKIAEYRIEHDWRKPKPGMLRQAADDFNLDLAQCWMIGDAPRDIAAGAAAGCRTILLQDPNRSGDADTNGSGVSGADVSPNYVVKSLADAARIIAREGRGLMREPTQAQDKKEEPVTGGRAEAAGAATAFSQATPAATPATPPRVDQTAIVAQVTESIVRALENREGKHDKALEDLVTHLRHAQRRHDYQADFSLGTLAAIVLQFAAACMLVIGVVGTLQAGALTSDSQQLFALQRAHTWMLLGLGLQGMVIALVLMHRRK